MSFHAVTWALEQDLPTREKFTLVCLASYADPSGKCWPSQALIARQTGQSVRTVRACMERLEAQGYITRRGRVRGDGGRTSDMVRLVRPGAPVLPDDDAVEVDAFETTPPRHGVPTPPARDAGAPLARDAGAPGTACLAEPVIEPPTEPSSRNTPRATRAEDPAGFAEFWEAYPRRTARKAAVKAYAAALKRTTPEVLLAGAQAYARATAGRAAEHIAHGASWLNGDRWEDAPETPAGPRPSTPSRAEAHQLQALANVPAFETGPAALFARPAALEAPAPAWPADPAQGWDR